MDWKEVKKFLDENKETKEVKDYFGEISKDLMKGKEFTDKITAEREKAVNEFKSKGLNDIIKEKEKEFKDKHLKEFKETYKVEEPKDPATAQALKDIEELKKSLAEKDRLAKRLELKSKVLPKLKGFEDFSDLLISEDEAQTTQTVEKFSTTIETYLKQRVEEALKKGSYTPPGSGNGDITPPGKEIDLTGMSDEQVREYMKQV
jgi:predicted RNase H-like nuclease (RuvC/YqgF family)